MGTNLCHGSTPFPTIALAPNPNAEPDQGRGSMEFKKKLILCGAGVCCGYSISRCIDLPEQHEARHPGTQASPTTSKPKSMLENAALPNKGIGVNNIYIRYSTVFTNLNLSRSDAYLPTHRCGVPQHHCPCDRRQNLRPGAPKFQDAPRRSSQRFVCHLRRTTLAIVILCRRRS